jgi:hypothetical protein
MFAASSSSSLGLLLEFIVLLHSSGCVTNIFGIQIELAPWTEPTVQFLVTVGGQAASRMGGSGQGNGTVRTIHRILALDKLKADQGIKDVIFFLFLLLMTWNKVEGKGGLWLTSRRRRLRFFQSFQSRVWMLLDGTRRQVKDTLHKATGCCQSSPVTRGGRWFIGIGVGSFCGRIRLDFLLLLFGERGSVSSRQLIALAGNKPQRRRSRRSLLMLLCWTKSMSSISKEHQGQECEGGDGWLHHVDCECCSVNQNVVGAAVGTEHFLLVNTTTWSCERKQCSNTTQIRSFEEKEKDRDAETMMWTKEERRQRRHVCCERRHKRISKYVSSDHLKFVSIG